MLEIPIQHTCLERFLKYVTYDTQSAEDSSTYPSTEKQKILGAELVKELQEMGLKDAQMDEYGYVTATIEATSSKKVPVIGLIAHMDTSPEVTGANVKPQIHRNYQGGDIVLPCDPRSFVYQKIPHCLTRLEMTLSPVMAQRFSVPITKLELQKSSTRRITSSSILKSNMAIFVSALLLMRKSAVAQNISTCRSLVRTMPTQLMAKRLVKWRTKHSVLIL